MPSLTQMEDIFMYVYVYMYNHHIWKCRAISLRLVLILCLCLSASSIHQSTRDKCFHTGFVASSQPPGTLPKSLNYRKHGNTICAVSLAR